MKASHLNQKANLESQLLDALRTLGSPKIILEYTIDLQPNSVEIKVPGPAPAP
jgi:hypothetical protein